MEIKAKEEKQKETYLITWYCERMAYEGMSKCTKKPHKLTVHTDIGFDALADRVYKKSFKCFHCGQPLYRSILRHS